jgi:hypothetical protein
MKTLFIFLSLLVLLSLPFSQGSTESIEKQGPGVYKDIMVNLLSLRDAANSHLFIFHEEMDAQKERFEGSYTQKLKDCKNHYQVTCKSNEYYRLQSKIYPIKNKYISAHNLVRSKGIMFIDNIKSDIADAFLSLHHHHHHLNSMNENANIRERVPIPISKYVTLMHETNRKFDGFKLAWKKKLDSFEGYFDDLRIIAFKPISMKIETANELFTINSKKRKDLSSSKVPYNQENKTPPSSNDYEEDAYSEPPSILEDMPQDLFDDSNIIPISGPEADIKFLLSLNLGPSTLGSVYEKAITQ